MRKSRHTQWTVNPSRAGSQGLILAMIFSGFSLAGLQAFAAKPNPICGNGICEQRESKSCPLDCADDPGEPPEPPPSTGVPSCGCSGAGLSPAQAKAGLAASSKLPKPGGLPDNGLPPPSNHTPSSMLKSMFCMLCRLWIMRFSTWLRSLWGRTSWRS